jgi:hypothetical protein
MVPRRNYLEPAMYYDRSTRKVVASRNPEAREIHELTYLKHATGASEAIIRQAIEEVGNDRAKVARELKRRVARR